MAAAAALKACLQFEWQGCREEAQQQGLQQLLLLPLQLLLLAQPVGQS
jgi:hypothetical protein